jgi:hypothetical protein
MSITEAKTAGAIMKLAILIMHITQFTLYQHYTLPPALHSASKITPHTIHTAALDTQFTVYGGRAMSSKQCEGGTRHYASHTNLVISSDSIESINVTLVEGLQQLP